MATTLLCTSDSIKTNFFSFVSTSSKIGTVGSTGNAAGKPPHLHYSIQTLIPYPWRIDKSVQGWRKMFYLNPLQYLNERSVENEWKLQSIKGLK